MVFFLFYAVFCWTSLRLCKLIFIVVVSWGSKSWSQDSSSSPTFSLRLRYQRNCTQSARLYKSSHLLNDTHSADSLPPRIYPARGRKGERTSDGWPQRYFPYCATSSHNSSSIRHESDWRGTSDQVSRSNQINKLDKPN